MHSIKLNGRSRRIAVFAIAMALTASALFGSGYIQPQQVAARSISEMESEQEAIQSKVDAANDKIDELQGKIDAEEEYQQTLTEQITLYKEQIQLFDDQIAALEVEIENKNAEIDQLEDDIVQLEDDIAAKQVEIDDTFELFKTRMVALYQAGETSSLAMLLSSSSFGDFVTNIRLMQAVSQSDEQLEDDIVQLEDDIAAKQVEIDDTFELFKTRMVALYQAGETSSLAMLLSSSSFGDFVTNIRLMQAVSQSDEQLVDKLKTQKAEQEETKAEVEVTKGEVEEALAQVKEDEEAIILQREQKKVAQSGLEEAYQESKTAQEDMEALKAQYEDDLASALAEEQQVEEEIQAFYAEQARKQQEAQQAAQANGSSTSTNIPQVSAGDLSFRWPLPGYSYISSPYGSRWGGFHTGIDISGGGVYGASIVAAEAGTVILAASHYSYGNYVIVDHGGGYSTLYAHMSSIGCSVGDYVTKGQTIGYVGSTGNSTGPHLHFEVRINGASQNPQSYVSP